MDTRKLTKNQREAILTKKHREMVRQYIKGMQREAIRAYIRAIREVDKAEVRRRKALFKVRKLHCSREAGKAVALMIV